MELRKIIRAKNVVEALERIRSVFGYNSYSQAIKSMILKMNLSGPIFDKPYISISENYANYEIDARVNLNNLSIFSFWNTIIREYTKEFHQQDPDNSNIICEMILQFDRKIKDDFNWFKRGVYDE